MSTPIGSTGALGQGIGVASPVHHCEDVGLQLFQPACDLSLRFSERHQPLESSVVSPDSEGQATGVVLEVPHRHHHSKKLYA